MHKAIRVYRYFVASFIRVYCLTNSVGHSSSWMPKEISLLVNKFPDIGGTRSFITLFQELATAPYPVSDESSLHPPILLY
jgi:hypothetical protein